LGCPPFLSCTAAPLSHSVRSALTAFLEAMTKSLDPKAEEKAEGKERKKKGAANKAIGGKKGN
jgi:hypothetical protein